ncbi:ultraviolet-B receptor UVR8 isoform X2 [Amborella trichopoda]|uniref:ultraviolet-B receptor UVR8 isoform X2 n=1 Tax=Amborella trichopoda TaxID=13333 RepID=UPI0009BCEEA9|nr:ultraviolet-B receptor UVR8 isoform X2 [Amborella trichopoda]|eukprot:XP_020519942.1 ultraviolet-B receptor UVR8 isoform X2 [Amborella trichopoda]
MEEEEEEGRQVWSWGAGTEGQLATGNLQDELFPSNVSHYFSLPISHIACGGAHAIALTRDGKVMTWGRGKSGQLGHGNWENSAHPKHVKFLENFVICNAAAGWNHSGFVSDTGLLFTCGDGSFGQLGHGDYNSQCFPVEVKFFGSRHVLKISCGMRHSLVLLKDYARAPATNSYSAVDGHLYTWGRGFNRAKHNQVPQLLSTSLKFSQVSLGWNHALLLTDLGEVFMLGGNHHGKLSGSESAPMEQGRPLNCATCDKTHEANTVPSMQRVAALEGINVVQVATGSEHSAIVSESGVVMTWGWGEHGQLGLGNTCDQTIPQVVHLDRGQLRCRKVEVYCGSGFTFVSNTALNANTSDLSLPS